MSAEPPPGHPRMTWRSTAACVAMGIAAGGAAMFFARLAGVLIPWQVALPAGAAMGVLLALGIAMTPADPGDLEPPSRPLPRTTSALGDFGALHFAVQGAAGDPERFEQRIRPRLRTLAVERLWQRRGLDWRLDAHQLPAREVLGPNTWALLTAPPYSLQLTPAALDVWIDELEEL